MTQTTTADAGQTLNKGLSLTTFGLGYFEEVDEYQGLLGQPFDDEQPAPAPFGAMLDVEADDVEPALREEEQYVRRTTRTTATVRLFPYGGGWRVKYEKTSNSKTDSRLLASHDEEYMPYPPFGRERYRNGEYREACRQARENAEKAYRQIVVAMGGKV